jgi:hypothetical protein
MFLEYFRKRKNLPKSRIDDGSIDEVRLWVRGIRQVGAPPIRLADLFGRVGERDAVSDRPDRAADLRKEPVRVYPHEVPSTKAIQWE